MKRSRKLEKKKKEIIKEYLGQRPRYRAKLNTNFVGMEALGLHHGNAGIKPHPLEGVLAEGESSKGKEDSRVRERREEKNQRIVKMKKY